MIFRFTILLPAFLIFTAINRSSGQSIDTTSYEGLLKSAFLAAEAEAFPEAFRIVDKAIALHPTLSKERLMAQLQRGHILQLSGKTEPALQATLLVRDAWIEHHDSTAVEFGKINFNLGQRYFRVSKYPEAIRAFNKALELSPKTDDVYWNSQTELLVIYGNQGNFEACLHTYPSLLERRRELLRKALAASPGPERDQEVANRTKDIGTMKANQGIVYYNVGNVKEAIPAYEEGVALIQEAVGTKHRTYFDYAPVLLLLYRAVGQTDRALAFGKELWETTLKAKSYPAEAAFIGDALSTVHIQLNQNEQALPYALKGDSLYVAGGKSTSVERASLLLNLGKIYKALARYDEGMEALMLSQKIMLDLSASEHDIAKLGLVVIAEIKGEQGKYDEQVEILIKAKNNLAPHFRSNLVSFTTLLAAKANAHEQLGQINAATKEFQDLYQLFADQINEQFDSFTEQEQLSWQKVLIGSNYHAQNFALRHPKARGVAGLAFDLDVLFRGIAFSNRKYLLKRVRNSSSIELQNTYKKWLAARNELSTQYRQAAANRSINLDSLEVEATQLETSLARQSQAFKTARDIPGWEKLSQQLKPGEVIINFVYANKYNFDKQLPGKHLTAFILRAGGSPPTIVPLPGLDELKKRSTTKSLYTSDKGEQNSLHWLLYEPLRPYLNDVSSISYLPTGILHRINLGAIPVSPTATLSETYQLRRVSQVNELFISKINREEQQASAVLFGGINFDNFASSPELAAVNYSRGQTEEAPPLLLDSVAMRALSKDGWVNLAHTANEVTQIGKTLHLQNYRIETLMGSKATESAFKQLGTKAPSPTIIHLATHGYFFPKSKTDKEAKTSKTGFESARHPLVRSGLILAGANHAWRGGEIAQGQEDGILTAYEIAEMDLSNTELVVLSACETGLGDIDGSEGVFGLQRAFKMAGAKYVLMSLWNVKDQKTYEFMTAFYKLWQGGKTIPVAYQEAQSQMRAKYALPFAPKNWAGFVLLN